MKKKLERKDLPVCGVVFEKETHTYTINGAVLSGITSIIHRYICPEKYKDVPQDVLNRAAARGSYIHELCGAIVDGFIPSEPSEEQAAFMAESERIGKRWIASEWLLTDNEHFATAADLVADDCSLGDIKTTATLDKEYLSWQLSIEAEFLERINPKLHVPSLLGLHIRNGKCKAVEIERKPSEAVWSLIKAAANNEPWENTTKSDAPEVEDTTVEEIVELSAMIAKVEAEANELKARRDALLAPIYEEMATNSVDKMEVEGEFTLFKRSGAVRKTCDFDKLRELSKDIYTACVSEQTGADSWQIKLKK